MFVLGPLAGWPALASPSLPFSLLFPSPPLPLPVGDRLHGQTAGHCPAALGPRPFGLGSSPAWAGPALATALLPQASGPSVREVFQLRTLRQGYGWMCICAFHSLLPSARWDGTCYNILLHCLCSLGFRLHFGCAFLGLGSAAWGDRQSLGWV